MHNHIVVCLGNPLLSFYACSARLQELMGEEDGPADFQDERERLAAANAQRNIVSLANPATPVFPPHPVDTCG